jgi:hypothetical protein
MVDDPEAIYETWLDCYETAYQNPAGIRDLACPNCAQRMLALRFDVKVMEADLGIAKFWCESCLMGLMPNTATVPVGGARALWDAPGVPNYLVVVPPY